MSGSCGWGCAEDRQYVGVGVFVCWLWAFVVLRVLLLVVCLLVCCLGLLRVLCVYIIQ
ncbi:hypothetical protein POJ06DRAFT_244381 [Lipomyces tetrasporus]|uniref:Transmembrane protein n=1 Tax=Lipomyces tetrasporus TaxID=54092 RepID=A0AAD7QV25_9ASCO|nr:uncharacterized protein POJ06DRAFT_263828 [Lipomyces tetrasporus]XP_056043726.1 uncharacterized protein POJ06DRAFT_252238 [Lipomyces tetrasporus]XP_056045404.1 uncharacterized protein POJ06DRAFT_248353 [Lipomyces tetrasporus]XP_056047838.1 uncharacterized protein POJ06DRAFT_244381 [Lipomyces tetrasporus]KAJ8096546.1 hypothetical protein POJ06DRAFT_263828 [Lipomyces tetrasporus]KAJ8100276.1 hypothetical protein POJ06DRAFT_252238 [Lipomyces tetrasporus]KAJ8101954.1 hypothetical protein POJ06